VIRKHKGNVPSTVMIFPISGSCISNILLVSLPGPTACLSSHDRLGRSHCIFQHSSCAFFVEVMIAETERSDMSPLADFRWRIQSVYRVWDVRKSGMR